jgi:tRNA(Ile2)-agmatinylcytidine synthase
MEGQLSIGMTDDSIKEVLHVGFDDTDSVSGKCTTHIAYKITKYLLKNRYAEFLDYPLLIRLNPNVPWKTRGNGAVCLRLMTNACQKVIEYVKHTIEDESDFEKGANPAIVFLHGRQIPEEVLEFSDIAMFDVLTRKKAEEIARKYNIQYFTYGNGQGLVGSLAAIGCLLHEDHTFEAIAYRRFENCGTTRKVDVSNVIKYSNQTFPNTFNNYDPCYKRILITPHGPDPIFCGIRGEEPEIVVSSLGGLDQVENLDGYMVFRSNQGTNMHLRNEWKLSDIRAYLSGYVRCTVNTKPSVMEGGHVIFTVKDSTAIELPAAVYAPTDMTSVASQLEIGDSIEIGVGVKETTFRYPKTLNVEYLSILMLVQVHQTHNPFCVFCNKRMKSEGRKKGFQCHKCGHKDNKIEKIDVPKNRNINLGLYVPTQKSQRHLTKPMHRYGMEKHNGIPSTYPKLFPRWFFSSSF